MNRRVWVGFAGLEQWLYDAAIICAGIEQHPRARCGWIHGYVLAGIYLRLGGYAKGQSGEQGQGRNSQSHQAVPSPCAGTIDAETAPLNIAYPLRNRMV